MFFSHSSLHLCSRGRDCPSFQSPDSGGEGHPPARSQPHSRKRPRHPTESCCPLCDQNLESRGFYTSPALGKRNKKKKKEWLQIVGSENSLRGFHPCLVTCAVFAISTVRARARTSVRTFCVQTSGVFVAVGSQSALVHIWSHTLHTTNYFSKFINN